MATKKPTSTEEPNIKTLLLGVQAPYNHIKPIQVYFDEFLNLVSTLGLEYAKTLFLKIRKIDKTNFLTKGKLLEISDFCKKNGIEEVVFSEILSPLQERNLADFLDCIVWDREKLILEIFKKAAHTSEGKIQVDIAEIEFLKARLAGKGIELAQQAGIIGTRGPGETSKEIIRRHLAEKYHQAKKRLDIIKKSKSVQRKKRLGSKIPFVCLVGYTNAGKSSLLNLLTKSDVLVEDKLFATLDTTTRKLFLNHQKMILISDTVGFISQLPHHLIEAFKTTLEELNFSNLILHVVDLSNSAWKDQINVVKKTLNELQIEQKILYVFNKIDKIKNKELKKLKTILEEYDHYVLTHTKSKDGIKDLLKFLQNYKFK